MLHPHTDLARPVAVLEVGLDLVELEDEVVAEVGHVAPLPPLATDGGRAVGAAGEEVVGELDDALALGLHVLDCVQLLCARLGTERKKLDDISSSDFVDTDFSGLRK